MDDRTFWLGLLGGVVGGLLIVAAGYFTLKAYLPPQDDDPLYKMKQSFLPDSRDVSRSAAEAEIRFLYRDRDKAPAWLTS